MSSIVLITGSAGFIGFHLSHRLLKEGVEVIGIDSLNNYYEVSLKEARNNILKKFSNYTFYHQDLTNYELLKNIFTHHLITKVIHLAAQAGVRYSITHPHAYIHANVIAFLNILETCKNYHVKHLLYASSSSVYGDNREMPFSVGHRVDHPVSFYAATKKSNELMAHTYAHNFGLVVTGLRFFTTYGPWSRPDMALFLFTKSIIENKPIDVFNHGKMKRDFTYIDDVIESVYRLMNKENKKKNTTHSDFSTSFAPYYLFNIGNGQPIELMKFIYIIEKLLGKKAIINYQPPQKGEINETYADIQNLKDEIAYQPKTSLFEGVKYFVDWYKEYYNIKIN